MNQIDDQFKEIAKGADLLEVPKYLQTPGLKYPKPITAVDDAMYLKNNDTLYNYIQARRVRTTVDGKPLYKDSDEALEFLNQLPKNTQKNAKVLKEKINELGLKYGKLLSENTDEALADLGATIVANGGAYLKQVYSVMKNKAYQFDPQKVAGAKEFFIKNTIPKLEAETPELITDLMQSKNITRKEAIELSADNTMAQLQKSLIESNRSPETLFKLVGDTFRIGKKGQLLDITKKVIQEGKEVEVFTSTGKLLKAGGDMPTIMKKVMDDEGLSKVQGAFLEPLKDYRAAVTDTFLQTAKQVYKKQFFDKFADNALKNGYAFRSVQEAINKGIPNANNLTAVTADLAPGSKTFDLFESDLFKGGLSRDGTRPSGLYTTPEIANAVKGTEEYLTRMYDIPLYSALMSVKAAGQIGKTVFSPMTQIRNVSTASFFALASGLIGGRVSLTDSFKLMADDIFPSKFVSAADVAKKMEDRIARGVVDQNIEVNEIKAF